jgi:formate/nitrite transporter FocA (FNT family)
MILGVLAGFWVGMGTILMITVAGGLDPEFRAKYPAAPKALGGLFFPVAIW